MALVLGALLGCPSDEPKGVESRPDASAEAPAPMARAKLKRPKGTVNVKRAAGNEWIVAQEGMNLFENDKVRTSADASTLVETENGSLEVGGDALIAIPEAHGDVTLIEGHIDARIDANARTLQIKTPAADVKAGREIFIQ